MAKENAIFDREEQLNDELVESFDFDVLEEKLQSQLEEELADMQFLMEEKEKIGNPDNLGNVIMDVIWEQFLNQVAVTAGEDFIKENNCKWQVLFHKFWQLFFHNYRHFIFHIFNPHGLLRGSAAY